MIKKKVVLNFKSKSLLTPFLSHQSLYQFVFVSALFNLSKIKKKDVYGF